MNKQSINLTTFDGRDIEIARFKTTETGLEITARGGNVRLTAALLLSLGTPVEVVASYKRETRNRVRWAVPTNPGTMALAEKLQTTEPIEVAHRVLDTVMGMGDSLKAARKAVKAANPGLGYQAPSYSHITHDDGPEPENDDSFYL